MAGFQGEAPKEARTPAQFQRNGPAWCPHSSVYWVDGLAILFNSAAGKGNNLSTQTFAKALL
jgi:hypothetical protein